MLRVHVAIAEDFDDAISQFIEADGITLCLEHSLLSLSKWESRWEIPFLGKTEKTNEQIIDYIRAMFLGEEFPEVVVNSFTAEHYNSITSYIDAKMTATWFGEARESPSQEVVTSELIYYWMIQAGVPFECQNWHLNRLLTLLKICSIKNGPKKKMNWGEAKRRQRELNDQRRREMGTRG